MEHRLLDYKTSKISYYRYGRGLQPVICFHGYAENGQMYAFFGKHGGDVFTFYSLDLPFHGFTEWNDGAFTHRDLQEVINEIFRQNNVPPLSGDSQVILMGFSLGGRIALSLYQSFPVSVKKLVLLAPDGLKVNFWYWLATQTWLGNKLFALTMKRPHWFLGFLKLMNKMGMVNASIFKFVNYYIGDAEVRRLLYARWTCLRKLRPNLSRIKHHLLDTATPVRLIYGKHDRIILPSVGQRFIAGMPPECTIMIINSGHQVLHEKHVEEILPALIR